MKTSKILAIVVLALGLTVCLPEVSEAALMGTAWTYQGRLMDANSAADGLYDFQFKLYDDSSVMLGNQVGDDVNIPDIDVIDGYFTAELDFGTDPNIFNGDARWLEIRVRPGDSNDANAFVTLSPWQEITPTAYALYAATIDWDNLNNVPAGFLDGVDNDTLYLAGEGLMLSGTTFAANTSVLQRRVATSCPVGSSIRAIDASGNVICEPDNDTLYVAGEGLMLSGTTFAFATSWGDNRYLNEGQANSITTGMIVDGTVGAADIATNGVGAAEIAADAVAASEIAANAVEMSELADPLNIGTTTWDWDFTSGQLYVDKTSGYPCISLNNSTPGDNDCLWARGTSSGTSTGTWNLYSKTWGGKAGYFNKLTDDNEYAVYISTPGSSSEGLYVYGTLTATGTKSAAIETSQGREAIFCVESPEVEIYCSGTGQLAAGSAHVAFDRLFTEAISLDVKVRVTVTPVGGWSGLYVESVSSEGFDVGSGAGDQNIEFHWMACGRRKGYEARPRMAIPDEAEEERIRELKEAARPVEE